MPEEDLHLPDRTRLQAHRKPSKRGRRGWISSRAVPQLIRIDHKTECNRCSFIQDSFTARLEFTSGTTNRRNGRADGFMPSD